MKRPLVLVILDGWGIGREDYSNPIHIAQPKTINYIRTHYLSSALQSSGIAVGLPWEEEGNSEVGHLNIGAGKIVYQNFPRISLSIKNGEFFKNPTLREAAAHVKNRGSALNLIGLASTENIESSLEHLKALLVFAGKNQLTDVNLHLITDGKNSPPRSAPGLIAEIKKMTAELGLGAIVTVVGRYYALDEEQRWDNIEKTYRALTEDNRPISDLEAALKDYYSRGLTDEFIEPLRLKPGNVKDGDALIFFNFREDSIRELAAAFIDRNFSAFPRRPMFNLFTATMTSYSDGFEAPAIFPKETVMNPISRVLSEAGRVQLKVAESKKYAHVTYFFNGYREPPFENEYRIIIPSKRVALPDDDPAMMAKEITARIIEAVGGGGFDFVLANYANPDIIAHTGNYDAALQAIKIVDGEINTLLRVCLERRAALMITSDHGHIERMIDPYTGRVETRHGANLVPLYLIGQGFEREKTESEAKVIESEASGVLSDVAPTALEVMDIAKPKEMTSQSIIKMLR